MHDGDDCTPPDWPPPYTGAYAPTPALEVLPDVDLPTDGRSTTAPADLPIVGCGHDPCCCPASHALLAGDGRVIAIGDITAAGVVYYDDHGTPDPLDCPEHTAGTFALPPDVRAGDVITAVALPAPEWPDDHSLDAVRYALNSAGAAFASFRGFAAGGLIPPRPPSLAALRLDLGRAPIPRSLVLTLCNIARQTLDAMRPFIRQLIAAGAIADPAEAARQAARARMADLHRRYAHRRGHPGRRWHRRNGRPR